MVIADESLSTEECLDNRSDSLHDYTNVWYQPQTDHETIENELSCY